MDVKLMRCLFALVVLMLQPSSDAVEILLALTCNSTRQPDGSFFYQLSQPSSSSCNTCWEDENNTVIVRDSMFDTKLVQNLTVKGIFLRHCREYLHYMQECSEIYEEAHCRVNCSSLLNLSLSSSPPAVTSTKSCLFGSWCLESLICLCVGVILLAAVMGLLIWLCIFKSRRGSESMTASYTPTNDQIQVIGMEMGQRGDIL